MTPDEYTKGIDDIKYLARKGTRKEIEMVMLKLWDSVYTDGVRLHNIYKSFGIKEH